MSQTTTEEAYGTLNEVFSLEELLGPAVVAAAFSAAFQEFKHVPEVVEFFDRAQEIGEDLGAEIDRRLDY